MKRRLGKIVSVLSATFLLSTLTGCVSLLPDFSEKQIAKFQSAQGTPKDSVVFYGFLPMNDIVKFKQIEKNIQQMNRTELNFLLVIVVDFGFLHLLNQEQHI